MNNRYTLALLIIFAIGWLLFLIGIATAYANALNVYSVSQHIITFIHDVSTVFLFLGAAGAILEYFLSFLRTETAVVEKHSS